MKSFQKSGHSSQRQSRGDHTHSFSANETLYEAYRDKVSSVPYFVVNGDIEIKHVDTEEQIVDIFTKPLYSDLFGYLCYKFDSLYINGILLHKGVLY